MKRFLLTVLIAITSTVFMYGQRNVEVDPVMLGPILVDQPSVEKMGEICRSYRLEEISGKDEFITYNDSNGTEIRFKIETVSSKKHPTVIVITKESKKEIEKILAEAGYKKEGDSYVKGSKFEHRRTKCRISGGNTKTLTFEKEYNNL